MLCHVLGRRCALHGMLSRSKWVPWSETRGFCHSSEPRERRKYEAVIGIEVHAQLDVQTKLFSGAYHALERTLVGHAKETQR